MKEKILITGANGFIGSRLTERLMESGANVIKLDRAMLTLPKELSKFMDDLSPDIIFHLAAYGNHYNQKDTRETYDTNLFGTFNLLEAAKGRDIKCFVNTGSSSEYGRKNSPMRETSLPETNTIYGATKLGTTYLAKAYASEFGLPAVTVRPFSVYGPGEAEHRFIPTIVRCALTGETLKLAPGVHDWIYIDDFIDGIITASQNISYLKGEIINIGSGKQYTNSEIVAMVEELCGITVNIEGVGNIRNFDTTICWKANNSKLRSLGWKPKTSIKKGLKKVIDGKGTNRTPKENN